MFQNIPIIGIVGGVGSGKSFVAKLFGELGCLVISSDEQVSQAYALPDVRRQVAAIWGDDLFDADGVLNRKRLAAKVFTSPEDRRRLEALIHPVVARLRDDAMRSSAVSAVRPVAFVWDTPLLFEAEMPGTEILHPVAVVIFSGLLTSTLLDSFLTPAMVALFGRKPIEALVADSGDESF